MDAAARRRHLFEKVTANNQRRRREELLSRLPPHLSNALAGSPCIYSVAIDPILRRCFPFNHSGIGSEGFVPPHYTYAEVAWESKVFGLLPRLAVPRLARKAFLLLAPPSGVHFEGQGFYLPDAPLFVVDFPWAVPLLKDLWPYGTGVLGLVEEDLRAGVLISNYIGYLPADWNPKEIVYTVGLWPTETDDPDA